MSDRISRMVQRSNMINREIENVANVARQLANGYYSDSTHDETQRAADFLQAMFNEREAEMNDSPIGDAYSYVTFAAEYAYFDYPRNT